LYCHCIVIIVRLQPEAKEKVADNVDPCFVFAFPSNFAPPRFVFCIVIIIFQFCFRLQPEAKEKVADNVEEKEMPVLPPKESRNVRESITGVAKVIERIM